VCDPRARPGVGANGAEADATAAAVRGCPTGALHTERGHDEAELPEAVNTATPTLNGPTYLRGDFALLTADGEVALHDTRIALCRCGASQHKPFCDGSHSKSDFKDDAALRAPELPATVHGSGRVEIRARTNGPLMLTGPLTVVGSNGREAFAESTFLCRCGASGNKPYCDGTHKRVGFTA
jgi:CDGSH-type Zn-finger protein